MNRERDDDFTICPDCGQTLPWEWDCSCTKPECTCESLSWSLNPCEVH